MKEKEEEPAQGAMTSKLPLGSGSWVLLETMTMTTGQVLESSHWGMRNLGYLPSVFVFQGSPQSTTNRMA